MAFTKLHDYKLQARFLKTSFYDFFKYFWSEIETEDFIDNWHIEYLCNELQKIVYRVKERKPKLYDLCINIPPSSTKSTITTIMLPAFAWAIDPTIRIISCSYSGGLALGHSVSTKDIINSKDYQIMFDAKIRPDISAKSYYKNYQGGDRLATGIGGGVPGKHGLINVVDDPIKPRVAVSDGARQQANDFVKTTLPTRKVSDEVTVTILVMQRLHEKDPTNVFLDHYHNVKHICLPGELTRDVEPDKCREHYSNGLLDPHRHNWDNLKEKKIALGSYGYASQILQRPAPAGGQIYERDWFTFKPLSEFPYRNNLDNIRTDWDTAYSEKETKSNSASSWVTSGKDEYGNMWIWDLGWVWKEAPDLVRFIINNILEPHFLEPRASGKSLVQLLNQKDVKAGDAKEIKGDKVVSARTVTPKIEAGKVIIAEKFKNDVLNSEQGLLKFPNNEYDDLSDALSQAIANQFNLIGKQKQGGTW